MSDERDSDRTSPDLGAEEPTNPGVGAPEAFGRACGDLERAVRSITTLARAYETVRPEGRRRYYWELALMAGEGAEIWFEFRRAALMQMRLEQGEDP